MDQDESNDSSMEQEVVHQLLQQLSICKRTLADCSASLIELSPLYTHLPPIAPASPVNNIAKTLKEAENPTTIASLTHTQVTIWERELKETREACRELECVAEDRENRLIQLERALADSEQRASSSVKECEELRSKCEFQMEVSQRIARHYHTLKNSVNSFQTLYQALESSLEQSRHLFAQSEQKINELQALQAKVAQSTAKRREMSESLENQLRAQEIASRELQCRVDIDQGHISDLKTQLDSARATLDSLKQQLQEKTSSQVKQAEIASTQSSLIETLQASNQHLQSEIKVLCDSIETAKSKSEQVDDAQDEENTKLKAQLLLLSTRIEEMQQHREELISAQRVSLDLARRERDEINAEKSKMEEKMAEIERQNNDLKELLAMPKRFQRLDTPQYTPSQHRSLASTQSPKTTTAAQSRTSFASPTSRLSSNSSNHTSSNRSQIILPDGRGASSNPVVFNDSVMEVDENSDPLRPLSPLSPMHDRPMDLLGDFNPDLLQYRGLKCCGEPAVGFTVTCFKCQEMFHLSCVEAIRSKALPKKQKFLCHICDPTSKAPKPRKPRLTLVEYGR
jgi:myosin heavy subunit